MTHPGQFQWWNFVKDGKIIQILGSSTSKNCCFSSKRLQNHAKPLLVATDGFETHHLRCSLVWEWGIVPMVWYGGFLSHVGTPTAGWFITEKTIYKWMIWGYSYFMKPPYIYNIYTYIIYIYIRWSIGKVGGDLQNHLRCVPRDWNHRSIRTQSNVQLVGGLEHALFFHILGIS